MVSMEGLTGFLRENSRKAMDAAKEAATIAKMKADIKAEELKMSNTYVEIGKLFCAHATGEIDEVFIPLLQKIADSKEKVMNLEAELNSLKKTVTCPECGAKSPVGSSYCNACGAGLKDAEVTVERTAAADTEAEDVTETAEKCAVEEMETAEKCAVEEMETAAETAAEELHDSSTPDIVGEEEFEEE